MPLLSTFESPYQKTETEPAQVVEAVELPEVLEASEQENTRNAILNVGFPLTLAVGLFIFFMKRNK